MKILVSYHISNSRTLKEKHMQYTVLPLITTTIVYVIFVRTKFVKVKKEKKKFKKERNLLHFNNRIKTKKEDNWTFIYDQEISDKDICTATAPAPRTTPGLTVNKEKAKNTLKSLLDQPFHI